MLNKDILWYIVFGVIMLFTSVYWWLQAKVIDPSVISATFLLTFAIVWFFCAIVEMTENKTNKYSDSMKFGDLIPGVYGIRINNFNLWNFYHWLPENPMMVVELCGRTIIVEFSNKDKAILQVAMGDYLKNLTNEDGFTVHKDGSVTENRG